MQAPRHQRPFAALRPLTEGSQFLGPLPIGSPLTRATGGVERSPAPSIFAFQTFPTKDAEVGERGRRGPTTPEDRFGGEGWTRHLGTRLH